MVGGVGGAGCAGTLRLAFGAPAAAQAALAALAPDNGPHAACRVEGSHLVVEATSDSMLGLLRTLDDVLACLRATGME